LPINGTLETGNYYVTMQLGTPPQNVTLLLDSGSSLLWVQCNDCADCTGLTEETAFQPELSTTITTPGCASCQDFQYGLCGGSPYSADPSTSDPCFSVCAANKKQCYYGYSYGDGSQTGGYIQDDVLHVPSSNSPTVTSNVTFGCNYLSEDPSDPSATSLIVSPEISGIVGLSKGNYSILSQMARAGVIQGVFSHCLAGVEGGGLFTLGNATRVVPGLQYIPMGTHPEFYNATIAGILVNNTLLSIPPALFYLTPTFSRSSQADPYFVPDAIFDSGTSFTILPDAAYTALAPALLANSPSTYPPVYIDEYGYIVSIPATTSAPAPSSILPEPARRNRTSTGSLCFEIPPEEFGLQGEVDLSAFPTVTFAFQGAALTVQPDDYMFLYEATTRRGTGSTILACPTFISDQEQGLTILGEYTLRNHYMVFDSQAGRIGIAPVNCSTFI
jgi:hypothetical protein